ncbi:MAG: hypothetical protein DRP63_10195 [Planctomycetota bacterium]|nr:MAG: hypothetical protein DRP63_10195 [Planctomycetota bacterium]
MQWRCPRCKTLYYLPDNAEQFACLQCGLRQTARKEHQKPQPKVGTTPHHKRSYKHTFEALRKKKRLDDFASGALICGGASLFPLFGFFAIPFAIGFGIYAGWHSKTEKGKRGKEIMTRGLVGICLSMLGLMLNVAIIS